MGKRKSKGGNYNDATRLKNKRRKLERHLNTIKRGKRVFENDKMALEALKNLK